MSKIPANKVQDWITLSQKLPANTEIQQRNTNRYSSQLKKLTDKN